MLDVLIVEDDLTIADLLQEALEADGYHVTGIARTVKAAVHSADQFPPDFAIIDVRLANGDWGTDVGVHLRATTASKILFSTGNDHVGGNLAACGDAVMIKPYRLSDVGRGLKIIEQLSNFGKTTLAIPRNFRLLSASQS